MLRDIKKLKGYSLVAKDGGIGPIKDFYFDDRTLQLHYLTAEFTKIGEENKKVLISAVAFDKVDESTDSFFINLILGDVEKNIEVDMNETLPQKQEAKMLQSSDRSIPLEEMGGGLLEEDIVGLSPDAIVNTLKAKEMNQEESTSSEVEQEEHLRSAYELIGFQAQTEDGRKAGQIDGLLVDDQVWMIRHLVVDMGNLLSRKRIILTPDWIEAIDWAESTVQFNLSQEKMENSPTYEQTEVQGN